MLLCTGALFIRILHLEVKKKYTGIRDTIFTIEHKPMSLKSAFTNVIV